MLSDIFTFIALGTVLLDQLLKYLILTSNLEINLGVLTLHLVQNTGAGFGILKDWTLFLGIISLAAALLILFNYKKIEKKLFPQITWSLFLGGILGNLLDRWIRGFVIDFIDLGWWPAFNLADAVITIAVITLVIYYWRKDEKPILQKDLKSTTY